MIVVTHQKNEDKRSKAFKEIITTFYPNDILVIWKPWITYCYSFFFFHMCHTNAVQSYGIYSLSPHLLLSLLFCYRRLAAFLALPTSRITSHLKWIYSHLDTRIHCGAEITTNQLLIKCRKKENNILIYILGSTLLLCVY